MFVWSASSGPKGYIRAREVCLICIINTVVDMLSFYSHIQVVPREGANNVASYLGVEPRHRTHLTHTLLLMEGGIIHCMLFIRT